MKLRKMRGPGDFLRRAASTIKAAATLTREGRDSYPAESGIYNTLAAEACFLLREAEALCRYAAECDEHDAKRRVAQKKKAKAA